MKADEPLLTRVRKSLNGIIADLPNTCMVAAISGGTDSLALLHLLTLLRDEIPLSIHVAHVDHQIRADSQLDAAFVREEAAKHKLPFRLISIDVNAIARDHRLSLETAARKGRYSALLAFAREIAASAILVAHNRDDQAETILMHLFRGSGLDGLVGMQPLSAISPSHLIVPEETSIQLGRPILTVSRAEIETYCAEQDLNPRIDASNADSAYRRNQLRQQIIPGIEEFYPALKEQLITLSVIAREDLSLLKDLTEEAHKAVLLNEDVTFSCLSRPSFLLLPLALQRRVLRESIRRLSFSLQNVGMLHVDNAIQLLKKGEANSYIELPAGIRVHHDGDQIIIQAGSDLPSPDWPGLDADQQIALSLDALVTLPGEEWSISLMLIDRPLEEREREAIFADPWQALFDADFLEDELFLRTRRAGDRFFPQGAAGSRTISNFLTDQKAPRPIRNRLPLLISGKEIVWVCGYRVDQRACITPQTRRMLLVKFSRE